MAIITVDKVSLAFGSHVLFDKISFGVEKHEKIGLIGRNGSGKSSLLKAMANIVSLDDGQIYISNGVKVVYVPQEPVLDPNHTIFDEMFFGLGLIKDLLAKYHKILDILEHDASSNDDVTKDLLGQLNSVQEELEHNNAWNIKNSIDKILSALNLDENWQISTLSGGVKKKVAIAKALVTNPDVMLLDEPTNHLDIATTIWLEDVIKNFPGSIVLITHDRMFLDHTVDKIIELDRGRLAVYPGSYAKYQEWKSLQSRNEDKINNEFDKFLAKEEIWVRKGIEARRTRNEGRVRRLEQLRNERQQRRERLGRVKFEVDSGVKSGKIVANLEKVNISLDGQVIVKDFTTTILRGDKIGLIGSNGIGKSTLLKVILGQLKVDSGKVELGTKITVAYFDQFREQLDETATIKDVVSQGQDFALINGRRLHIATYLEEFLFTPERFRSPVKALSGGERNRLLLARLFSRPANVLVLDEPTNDLDVDTLELLEELLANYPGTVFLVSHDREFLDNVVTESLVFLGEGEILEIAGGYSDWLEYSDKYLANTLESKRQRSEINSLESKENGKSTNKTGKNKSSTVDGNIDKLDKKQNRLSYKEKIELDGMLQVIQTLEREQSELSQQLLDAELYKKSPQQAHDFQLRLSIIETEILDKLARWEYLEQKTT